MADSETGVAQYDQDIWTAFETEEGSCGSESADGNPVWGAYCPQDGCGELNLFKGNPSGFVNRPYRCESCGWVSLMHESAADLEVVGLTDTHHGSVAASRLAAELGHSSSVERARVQFPHRIHLKVSGSGLSRTQLKTIREFGWDVSGFTIDTNGVSVIRSDRLVDSGGEAA